MSLINDALKQTKQARQENAPPNPPPLSPVNSVQQEGLGWLVPGIIVLLLAAAGIFILLSLYKPTPLVASARPVTNSPPLVVPAVQQVKSASVTPPAVTNAVAVSNSPAVVVPPKPPEPKLQGILFAASRPCAIVSGRTVFIGDEVGQFRVATISKNSVTLQNQTETKVLSLNPQ